MYIYNIRGGVFGKRWGSGSCLKTASSLSANSNCGRPSPCQCLHLSLTAFFFFLYPSIYTSYILYCLKYNIRFTNTNFYLYIICIV